ncbi:MAG: PilT/PilU family type 4a pilus ATPase [Selenomonadaceae bacterium]
MDKEIIGRWSNILQEAIKNKVSDIHLAAGQPPFFRKDGKLFIMEKTSLSQKDMQTVLLSIVSEPQQQTFVMCKELDFAYVYEQQRFRINVFQQSGTLAMAIRLVCKKIASLEELGCPKILQQLVMERHGLLLITGRTGSGKTSTLAAIIDLLNATQALHIITLEDPIEYVYETKKSLINQREAGKDFVSFATALRSALREDPDIILVGELRDAETMMAAMTAAETGHLVLGTLHTFDAIEAIMRIEGMFSTHNQEQIRLQLSLVLNGIVSQQLLPGKKGGRVCAAEVLVVVPAIRNLIRTGKPQQISSHLQAGSGFGMMTMNMSIDALYHKDKITLDIAKQYSKKDTFHPIIR